MNASDIIKAKQNQTLYKAYNKPTIFPGIDGSGNSVFVRPTVNYYPVSSTNTQSSFTSCINVHYLYECQPTFISYQLANDIASGAYVCGGKVPSKLTWKANPAMGQSENVVASTGSTITSANSFAVLPMICTNPKFYQGTNFASQCEVCNNFGEGAGACCHNCS